MPTTYSHFRLGQEVLGKLGETERELILSAKGLYDIGLHGPDLLFYYDALKKNPVNSWGSELHRRPGSYFFTEAAKVLRGIGGTPEHTAYVYGFICHFAMDVVCHGYVDEKIDASGVSHSAIEADMDRALMEKDGLDPLRHKVTGHLKPSYANANVIRAFYPQFHTQHILKALKDMVFFLDLLVVPSKIGRKTIFTLMKAAGKYEDMGGLVITDGPNPACADSTERLLELYDEAVELAVRLITEYDSFVREEAPLNDRYDYNFSSVLPEERNITHEI